ncbi:MAG: hypothetical protein RRA32_04030 [bacterium]|nr:hypothetical protein [bacterium]
MKDKRTVNMRAILVPAGLLVLLVLLFPPVSQAEWSTRGDTTTVLESYEDPVSGDGALPAYQYLRLNLRDGTGDGSQAFRLYGRLAGDLNDAVDAESRLYYAYYQKKGIWAGADLRVGRQWVNTVAGSPILDGIRIDRNWDDLLTLSFFGGGYVTVEEDEGDETIWGFSIKDDLWAGTDLSASYLQKWDGSDLATEILGVAGRTKVAKRGSAYGEFQYDMLSRLYSYYLAGVRLVPGEKWTVRSEYFGYTPVFDSTSVYSVFAVDQYEEVSVSADYRLDRSWTLFGSYTREMYESFDDSNVVEAGCELRKKGGYGGYVAAVYRSGDEDLKGIKVDYRMPAPYDVKVDVGAEYNVYNRIDDEDDDTTAKRYWLEGVRDLSDDLTLRAKVERVESVVYDYYNRGRVSLRYRF